MATHRWGAVAQLAAAQHGVLSRAQAAELGIERWHVRGLIDAGLIDEALPGVLRMTGSPPTWEQSISLATLAGGGTVASHRTAARVHRLDGFGAETTIEVCVPRGRCPSIEGVVVHRVARLDSSDITRVGGLSVTSIARTLSDLGAVVSDAAVERALDDAIRRGASTRWIESTHDRLVRPGPSGTGALSRVRALEDRAGRVSESWRERVTERLLRHPELQPIARQHEIRDEDGKVIARPDLAVVAARVGIEYHSDQWHFGPRRGRADRRRDLAAARVGWELLYLDATDHRSPEAALDAVLEVVRLRRRIWTTGS
jgi:hypothetical protein